VTPRPTFHAVRPGVLIVHADTPEAVKQTVEDAATPAPGNPSPRAKFRGESGGQDGVTTPVVTPVATPSTEGGSEPEDYAERWRQRQAGGAWGTGE
jgi:hypothetical protein